MKVVTAEQMREMDRQTTEDYGMPSLVLMENAALRVVEVLAERHAPLTGKRVAVVCGKGNNGGDGLAIARHLAARFGADVTVWLITDPAALHGDAAANYHMARTFGLTLKTLGDTVTPELGASLAQSDIIVDALLGTGIRGKVEGVPADVIDAINAAGRIVVAVDIPSGLNADTGTVAGPCVRADLTVTFALPKYGLLDYPGVDQTGELVVGDIGMPRPVLAAGASQVSVTEAADVARWLPARVNGRDSNKGKFGQVMVFAGSEGFIGASIMVAEAAARAGAGLVTLAVPKGIQQAVMARVSPIVMTQGLPQTEDGGFSKAALADALALAEKGTAAALGPGLGATNPETREFVRGFIARCPTPLVADADALNVLAQEPDLGTGVVKGRDVATVLTPHPGEMGRLLSTDTPTVQSDRRGAVTQAATAYHCTALLKGARTLIASPDGRLNLNTTSNAGMATGGSGDVLTGVIAALLAQHLPAHEAAAASAYLHGLAGDLVAERHGGATGLIATDIIDFLPRAIGRCQGATL